MHAQRDRIQERERIEAELRSLLKMHSDSYDSWVSRVVEVNARELERKLKDKRREHESQGR